MKIVSPTFDPRNLKGDLPAITRTRKVFEEVHTRLNSLHKAEQAIDEDLTLNDAAKGAHRHRLRTKTAHALKNQLEGAYADLGAAVESVEKRTKQRLTPEVKRASGEEIRRHVSSLGSRAQSFVMERITAGDVETTAAVLFSPSFLSGLTDKSQLAIREHAIDRIAPDLAADRVALRKAERVVERAGVAFKAEYLSTSSNHAADASDARVKAVDMAAAGGE